MQGDGLARRDQDQADMAGLAGQFGQGSTLDAAIGAQPFRLIGGE
jgi:hypothetical protein